MTPIRDIIAEKAKNDPRLNQLLKKIYSKGGNDNKKESKEEKTVQMVQ